MTPAQWKRLAVAASARAATCGPVPGLVALRVLQALLWRLAGGGASRSQSEIAQELGLSERALRAGLKELQSHGLVWQLRAPEDARRLLPQVNETHVKAWAAGDLELEASEIGAENADSFGTYSKADRGENSPYPRVRAAKSSSSSFSSFSSEAPVSSDPLTSEEAFAEHAAMLAEMKRWQISTAGPGAKEYVWQWVGRYSVERVAAAALASWRSGARNVAYMETVLQDESARSQYPGSLRNFEDYRGLKPWHGNGKVDDEENA